MVLSKTLYNISKPSFATVKHGGTSNSSLAFFFFLLIAIIGKALSIKKNELDDKSLGIGRVLKSFASCLVVQNSHRCCQELIIQRQGTCRTLRYRTESFRAFAVANLHIIAPTWSAFCICIQLNQS